MVKSNNRVTQNLRGDKGKYLARCLKSLNLENVVIVPIEIGKAHSKALIANYFGFVIKDPFEFHNSQEGLSFLHKSIIEISKHQSVDEILVGMEATGHYYKKPAAQLSELGYDKMFILNPITTSHCRKAGLTWSKTDDIDLRAIGQSLISGYGNLYRPEEPLWQEMKELCRYRRFLVNQQTATKNRTHTLLDHLFSGVTELKIFSNEHVWSTAALDFFLKYKNLDAIKKTSPRTIIKFFNTRGRRVSPEAVHQLLKWSQNSLSPNLEANYCRQYVLKSLIMRLKEFSADIRQIEIELLDFLVQTPAVLLLSIKWVGPIRAGEFGGEVTPIARFSNSRALIKGAGLDSTHFQTATFASTRHRVSKKGSKSLRYITIEIADALMKHNEHFALKANNLIKKGKSKGCACIATATRFLRVAFWMLIKQETFQPSDGVGISKDPSGKIKEFLMKRNASELSEKYIKSAEKFFK